MADYYADSSVLVKRHVNEIGSSWVRALVDPAAGNVIITSRVSIVEVYSALNRRMREAGLKRQDYDQLAGDFASICAVEYQIIELTAAVTEGARALLEQYPLRAYDAIQLASAVAAKEALEADGLASPVFIAADER